MNELFGRFVLLFTVIDPIGSVPVFIAATAGIDATLRRKVAIRASIIALCILVGFVAVGQLLLNAIGISLASFQLAGSVILFLFALDMVIGESKPESEVRSAEASHEEALDLAVYPMAMPSIAGPGAILTAIILTDNDRHSIPSQLLTTLMIVVVMGLVLACLLLAARIQDLIGRAGASIVSRVMGLITAAIAADGILGGISDYFGLTPAP